MSTFFAKAALAERAATATALTHKEEPAYTKLYWTIANKVGLAEAALIQVIEAWCQSNRRNNRQGYFHHGEWWTCCASYADWQGRYPALGSARTIQRLFLGLEKQKYIVSCQASKNSGNLTKFYRINPVKVRKLLLGDDSSVMPIWHEANDTSQPIVPNLDAIVPNWHEGSSESLVLSSSQPLQKINKIRSINTIQEQPEDGLCVCENILLKEENKEEDSEKKIDEITKQVEVNQDFSSSVQQNQDLGNSETSNLDNTAPAAPRPPQKPKYGKSAKYNCVPDWFPGDEHEYKQFVKYKGKELLQNPPMNIKVDAVNSRAVAINVLNANVVASLALYEGWKDCNCPSEPPGAATPLNAQNNSINYKLVTPDQPKYNFDSLNPQVHGTYYQEFLEKGESAFTQREQNAAWLAWAKAKYPERFAQAS
ncbi:hypothetical protein [Brasilonema sp. UFV-L1]|uniref:hypothetical protein n=1 Tax=Brasilonema sp. UFV-L1 TaxID=2234130 RepID=UPI00145C4BDA|nr:hypothetical protein [Brasilonema sp. UFV-L1]NMG10365.1 hypothetical protein [Brasilonema sp. UFV-L1]